MDDTHMKKKMKRMTLFFRYSIVMTLIALVLGIVLILALVGSIPIGEEESKEGKATTSEEPPTQVSPLSSVGWGVVGVSVVR